MNSATESFTNHVHSDVIQSQTMGLSKQVKSEAVCSDSRIVFPFCRKKSSHRFSNSLITHAVISPLDTVGGLFGFFCKATASFWVCIVAHLKGSSGDETGDDESDDDEVGGGGRDVTGDSGDDRGGT